MSFILDALKKSELERQRQNSPGLVNASIVRTRKRPAAWIFVLGALLAVNISVLAIVLLRAAANSPSAAHDPAIPVAAAPPPSAAATAATSDKQFSPLDVAPVYAPEIPIASTTKVPLATPAVPRASHRADPLLSDDDYKVRDEEMLPTMSELHLTGAQALPELHLDVHVFATQAADRFVYVNMRKYHEGATLQEGPTIERIRRDGVVLNYQGLRFLLPRQ